jgi:hypothetical protein
MSLSLQTRSRFAYTANFIFYIGNAVEGLNDKEFESVDKFKSVHEFTTKWESDKGIR